MDAASIVIIVLAFLIIIALGILYITRKRMSEIDGFRAIKEPGEAAADDDVIDSFGV